ncbi:hypothetical protein LCGC14_1609790 [marine sediment metagenome]|uniref:Uncharacterized protein n=1 Tax=marine sediment metagenome TaxID=412755 RepID=A0A0F9KPH5_9ZZZZ
METIPYKIRLLKHYATDEPCIITRDRHLARLVSKGQNTPIIIQDGSYYLYIPYKKRINQ